MKHKNHQQFSIQLCTQEIGSSDQICLIFSFIIHNTPDFGKYSVITQRPDATESSAAQLISISSLNVSNEETDLTSLHRPRCISSVQFVQTLVKAGFYTDNMKGFLTLIFCCTVKT